MNDIIHLLPDSVANQIAAGEVIQRPASCLKELVENSLDAHAEHIRVIVRDAGRTLLQVVDDGVGMSPTDARMAFERHATSKIKQAQDLFSLRTMGFRGEALASICAVAQVEVQTRREEDEVGTFLEIAGSKVQQQNVIQCAKGTNIRVKNLFYNVPARRKFLKTDATELRNLLADFYRIVLVYPQVQFTFVSEDEILLELLPGAIKQRIEAVFGHASKPYTGQLVEIKADTELVHIYGFVGKPETAGKNCQQYMFVNGRFMRHPYFHKAVMNSYSGMLLADHQPSYFIYFDIDPNAIDVNIHPTKTEVKFADEQAVFQILSAAVREALGKFNVIPSIDFASPKNLDIPAMNPLVDKPIASVNIVPDPKYNPFHQRQTTPPHGWEHLYPDISTPTESPTLFALPKVSDESPIMQWATKYIVIPTDSGLMYIHQHRAHTRIIYKELLDLLDQHRSLSQPLLFPEILDLDADDIQTWQNMQEDLQGIGFQIEQISPLSYSINAVPSLLGEKNASDVLMRVLRQVQDSGESAREKWQQLVALSLADQMAITAGQPLREEEMRNMIHRLFQDGEGARYLPDGRTIFTIYTEDEVQRRF